MDAENRLQLASLLDKISDLYRGGVPSGTITAPAPSEGKNSVQLRLVILGDESECSAEALSLLDGIATNGLRLCAEGYTKEFLKPGVDPFAEGSTSAPLTILFGFDRVSDSAVGTVILSAPLDKLLTDTASKKALWREIQQRAPR